MAQAQEDPNAYMGLEAIIYDDDFQWNKKVQGDLHRQLVEGEDIRYLLGRLHHATYVRPLIDYAKEKFLVVPEVSHIESDVGFFVKMSLAMAHVNLFLAYEETMREAS